ncbi:MAG: hypothetical protein JO072_13895 [Parafilimonas sp.]|nr:hypothetical protein [Parafilimonas sp.]
MKTFLYILFALSAALQSLHSNAQQATSDKIAGTWKGTSLCQVKQSACHDENVVYHISKKSSNVYSIQASKIINGKEDDMGTFDSVVYNETKQTLSFTMKDNQGRKSVWLFKLDGTQMHGTLTQDGNILFRIIELKKS